MAVLWLREDGGHDAAAIAYDSEYAAKVAQGIYKPKANLILALMVQKLVKEETARRRGGLRFIHVRGHSGDDGNDRADELVQWGKQAGPYCRIPKEGETPEERLRRRERWRKAKLAAELAAESAVTVPDADAGTKVRVSIGDTGIVLDSPGRGDDAVVTVRLLLSNPKQLCVK